MIRNMFKWFEMGFNQWKALVFHPYCFIEYLWRNLRKTSRKKICCLFGFCPNYLLLTRFRRQIHSMPKLGNGGWGLILPLTVFSLQSLLYPFPNKQFHCFQMVLSSLSECWQAWLSWWWQFRCSFRNMGYNADCSNLMITWSQVPLLFLYFCYFLLL